MFWIASTICSGEGSSWAKTDCDGRTPKTATAQQRRKTKGKIGASWFLRADLSTVRLDLRLLAPVRGKAAVKR
jgi:hypothetical protein